MNEVWIQHIVMHFFSDLLRLIHLETTYLEQRQNNNDSIQSKIIPMLKLLRFFPHRIAGEKNAAISKLESFFVSIESFLYCLSSRNVTNQENWLIWSFVSVFPHQDTIGQLVIHFLTDLLSPINEECIMCGLIAVSCKVHTTYIHYT